MVYMDLRMAPTHSIFTKRSIDFTLTLPGLFQIVPICTLAWNLNVEVLSKVTFAFTPDIAMSPLFLPKDLLTKYIASKIHHQLLLV